MLASYYYSEKLLILNLLR